jgi:enamine deaminase RidA (YjgF/YER057c/UK114 family)
LISTAMNDSAAQSDVNSSVATPAAHYIPTRRSGNTLYISGQVPKEAGTVRFIGRLGETLTVEQGQAAARLCAVNVIAQLRAALGERTDLIVTCLRVRGFVNATPDFKEHAAVINGASDLLIEVLGEQGRHSRTAIGVSSLPHGCAVEIDADFEVLDPSSAG